MWFYLQDDLAVGSTESSTLEAQYNTLSRKAARSQKHRAVDSGQAAIEIFYSFSYKNVVFEGS